MFERLKRIYVFAAVTLLSTLALFLLLSAGLHLYTKTALFLAARGERRDLDAEIRYRVAYPRLYPGMSGDDIRQLWTETDASVFEYSPFVQYRERAQSGRFVNISPDGFRFRPPRHPWPPAKDALNVFMFGGSTVFGYGVPDADTIPAALEDALAKMAPRARVRVYNFGRCGYYSGQEHVVFMKRVAENIAPDIAIFIDGTNEFVGEKRADRLPFSDEIARLFRREFETPSFILSQAALKIPLIALLREKLHDAEALKPGAPSRPLSADELMDVVRFNFELYLSYTRMTASDSREFGVKTLFVWQPVPDYRYDLTHHLFRADIGPETRARRAGYAWAARNRRRLEAVPNFLWLADIQESLKRPLYVDDIHYSPEMNRIIAGKLAGHLSRQGWLTK